MLLFFFFVFYFFFFFNDTATTEIYTLSLHDALPISPARLPRSRGSRKKSGTCASSGDTQGTLRSASVSPWPQSGCEGDEEARIRFLVQHANMIERKGDASIEHETIPIYEIGRAHV